MNRHHNKADVARRRRTTIAAVLLAGLASALAGCQSETLQTDAALKRDYRVRHPISVLEGDRKLEVFIGSGRGSLTPTQRAQVLAFAVRWQREGTGGFVIDIPAGTRNAQPAAVAVREIRSILAAAGAVPSAISVRPYHPVNPARLATVRVRYPAMVAQVGPCGLWPHDLGPTADTNYNENTSYWNHGCATQHNLAAMVDNPADLVQPRAETNIYAARRSVVLDKYRKGESTSTVYANPDKGTITDVGK